MTEPLLAADHASGEPETGAEAAELAEALRETDPDAPPTNAGMALPTEADPADAAEQAVPVPLDEDEYR